MIACEHLINNFLRRHIFDHVFVFTLNETYTKLIVTGEQIRTSVLSDKYSINSDHLETGYSKYSDLEERHFNKTHPSQKSNPELNTSWTSSHSLLNLKSFNEDSDRIRSMHALWNVKSRDINW